MLTVEKKNIILKKLIAMPCNQWRVMDPSDLDQREAIQYIIREDQAPGHYVEFNTLYSKVRKCKTITIEDFKKQKAQNLYEFGARK